MIFIYNNVHLNYILPALLISFGVSSPLLAANEINSR